MPQVRFSKARLLEALDKRAARVADEQKFDRSRGTKQLEPRGCDEQMAAAIRCAVEYGRMRGFEQIAEGVCENFGFDA
jgi:hypothetical protein